MNKDSKDVKEADRECVATGCGVGEGNLQEQIKGCGEGESEAVVRGVYGVAFSNRRRQSECLSMTPCMEQI